MDRKEAIEIITKNYPHVSNSGSQFESALRELIPELKESEDERIRRKMVEHFKSKTNETWCNIPVKNIIAYLEKQKEQKPAEWSEEDKNKIESIKGLITTGKFVDTNTIRTIWKVT